MSQQVTPPVPPSQRKPQNWFGIGCYVVIGLVLIVILIALIGMCSPHGTT